jgi:hypothetical protein
MAGLSAESTRRIADARRAAETVLKAALAGVRESNDVAPYLPAFIAFAVTLFDAEAEERLTESADADGFRNAIKNELAPRIVEDILPADLGITRLDEARPLSIKHDLDTGLLWELGPDGKWKRAGDEVRAIYAPRGDWERFMPVGVRFMAAMLPQNKAIVRAALLEALLQRVDYWLGRFSTRVTISGNAVRTREPHWQAEALGTSAGTTAISKPAEREDTVGKGIAEGRKRGPKPDREMARRIAQIVKRVAPNDDWREKLDDVCEALDAEGVPIPRRWYRNRNHRCWADCLERDILVKAIGYRIKTANQPAKPIRETFS